MTEFSKYVLNEEKENEPVPVRKTKGEINARDPIEIGSERNWGDQKSFVTLTTEPREKIQRSGKFVIKEFNDENSALEELKKALALSNAGIPVPPTHRLAFDEKSGKHIILYTDLSENGRNKVWSGNNTYEDLYELKITPEEFNALESKIRNISGLASKSKYILNYDSYFLVRKESGDLEVVIADLGIGVYESSEEGSLRVNERCFKETLQEIKKGVV